MPDFSKVKAGDSLVYILPGRKPEQQDVSVVNVMGDWITCSITGQAEELIFYRQTGHSFFGSEYGYLEPKEKNPRTR